MLVNTKNRNMPHPLHNFKFKGKMKYFTDVLKANINFSASLKSFMVVFLFTLAAFSVNAQNAKPKRDIVFSKNQKAVASAFIALMAISFRYAANQSAKTGQGSSGIMKNKIENKLLISPIENQILLEAAK